MEKLLIVIDMQNDFIDGALGSDAARAIVPRVAAKIAAYRAAGDAVIFTRDTHEADYLQTQEGAHLPVVHCVQGTEGWHMSAGLDVGGSVVLDKPQFGSLALADYVRLHHADAAEIELIGLCTDICVVSNALILKAALPETPIAVDAACCAGVTPEGHAAALATLKTCQVQIRGDER